VIVAGFDVAPTHTAAVVLRQADGPGPLNPKIVGHWYITTKKGVYDRAPDRAWLRTAASIKKITPGTKRMVRLDDLSSLTGTVLKAASMAGEPLTLAAVEDYVYNGRTSGSHDAGGAGDRVRHRLWCAGVPVREIPPGEIKRFVLHNWAASKDQVPPGTRKRWPALFMLALGYKVGADVDTFGDVIDAGWLARLGVIEIMLRRGYIGLAELEHDQERITYQGTTKNRTRCILDTPFTEKPLAVAR